MTDRPIIFSAPMILALLDGRKTQTRRLVTPQSCVFGSIPNGQLTRLFWEHADWSKAWTDRGFADPRLPERPHTSGYLHVPCHDPDEPEGPRNLDCPVCFERGWSGTAHRLYPRIQPGDRLWVKEAWARTSISPVIETIDKPWVVFRAADNRCDYGGPWKSPRYLARKESRLTLDVTSVRIERLQEISEEDAIAEGCRGILRPSPDFPAPPPIEEYRELWESLHNRLRLPPEQNPNCWAANPFVVAITFKVHPCNIDALPAAREAA